MTLLLNVIAIANGQEPDWLAADARVSALSTADLGDYFVYWNPADLETNPVYHSEEYLQTLRNDLRAGLADLRHPLSNLRRDISGFDFEGFSFKITGDLFTGEVPTALYDTLSSLHSVGALQAAGFEAVSVDEGRGTIASAGFRPPGLINITRPPSLLAGTSDDGVHSWQRLYNAGLRQVVSLGVNCSLCAPLELLFHVDLPEIDHANGLPELANEGEAIRAAASAAAQAVRASQGVFVRSQERSGRTATVLGCALRELGLPADTAVDRLRRTSFRRGLEPWQEDLVRNP